MPEPTQEKPGEETPATGAEKVEIAKAELEALEKRLHDSVGYTTRKLEELTKEYEAKMEEFRAEVAAGGDEEKKAELATSWQALNKEKKALQERERAVAERGLTLKALTLAAQYGIDAAPLASAKSEVEMENLALKAALEKKGQPPAAKAIDLGKGAASVRPFEELEGLYADNPMKYAAEYIKARRERSL